jgi:homoserine O-acetyltransferase
VNRHILEFLRDSLPDIMEAPGEGLPVEEGVGVTTKSSVFGEAEGVEDITAW